MSIRFETRAELLNLPEAGVSSDDAPNSTLNMGPLLADVANVLFEESELFLRVDLSAALPEELLMELRDWREDVLPELD